MAKEYVALKDFKWNINHVGRSFKKDDKITDVPDNFLEVMAKHEYIGVAKAPVAPVAPPKKPELETK